MLLGKVKDKQLRLCNEKAIPISRSASTQEVLNIPAEPVTGTKKASTGSHDFMQDDAGNVFGGEGLRTAMVARPTMKVALPRNTW